MEFKTTKVFEMTAAAWMRHPRYLSSCGGTRSGKTYSILQLLILQHIGEAMRGEDAKITSVVSESIPHLKRGAIRDFKAILQGAKMWRQNRWSETDKVYSFDNGGLIEFFSVDNAGKVYGSARDRLFVNEAQHIQYEIARQLFVRTRGRIVIDYNPTHEFWAMKEVECRDNCIRIHSTYKDNDFLSPEQVREIEDNKSTGSWWRVFGLGEVGTLDGLIYEFEQVATLPEDRSNLIEVQGLDFGFTNDPTARVQILADKRKKELYARERCYRTHMYNSDIVKDLQADEVDRLTPIYADCAEPKSIAEICDAGYNIIACTKDAPTASDKRLHQIQWLQGWRLFVTQDSVNLIHELRNYCWLKDMDGNSVNRPIDGYDHCLDALRYAAYSRFGVEAGYGEYNISSNKRR